MVGGLKALSVCVETAIMKKTNITTTTIMLLGVLWCFLWERQHEGAPNSSNGGGRGWVIRPIYLGGARMKIKQKHQLGA